ncbi:MAG: hypothetical protein JWO89_2915 [Verrucomicrobiaceae bacterium]|nr:hypothetical protein [Verrucomicrobiaceae bacterium]
MRSIFIACVLTVAVGAEAQAQSSRSETAQRLNQAVADRQKEVSAVSAEDASRAALVKTAAQARSELAQPVNAEQAAREGAGQKRMAEALQGMSPEGKALLAQNQARPPKVPIGSAPGEKAADAAPEGTPKPKPLKPEPLTEPNGPETKQTIITGDVTFFDSTNNIAVFVGNVVVDSPQFHITCDEFEVHMRKQAKDDADGKAGPDAKSAKPADPKTAKGTKGTKAAPLAAKPDLKTLAVTAPATAPGTAEKPGAAVTHDAQNPADASIESAIGKGRKVVIVKHSPDGKTQIGQSRHAYYDGNSGDITLRESPQVQDGNDLHISLEPTTVMVLTQNGALHTTGRATTKLKQADGQTAPTPGKSDPSAAARGTPPASGPNKASKGGLSIPGPVPGQ